jgi:NTP pyrophosphatase (non-canonical NTP hydrolase)
VAAVAATHSISAWHRAARAGEVATADDAHAPEELADVLEVVLALAADLGLDAGGLERLRAAKAAERDSFSERIVWRGSLSS